MSHNNHYNTNYRSYARENRQDMTKAEACLWKYALSKKQMLGYTFKRQRPIDNYIVDFICLSLKLIIEVDGYSHQIPEIEAQDQVRQKRLEQLGYTVVRFEDHAALKHINTVRDNIERWIKKLEGEQRPK